jgi:hypothetical protein
LPSSRSIEIRGALDYRRIASDSSFGGNDNETGQRFVGGAKSPNLMNCLCSHHNLRSPGTN